MASRLSLNVALRGAIRTPAAARASATAPSTTTPATWGAPRAPGRDAQGQELCGRGRGQDVAQAQAGQVGAPQPAAVGRGWGSSAKDAGGQKKGKKWDREQEREFQDKEWDNIGNL
ncbi:hypothetical protein PG997_010976 [Apiospora hydei]|uniref:Succinate dehydrogenase assembly factor 4, mitochondrial n=1 Tax=Apiospora hydei TaxID=1337664 RepID=A0ABR1VLP0_9PEZI